MSGVKLKLLVVMLFFSSSGPVPCQQLVWRLMLQIIKRFVCVVYSCIAYYSCYFLHLGLVASSSKYRGNRPTIGCASSQ